MNQVIQQLHDRKSVRVYQDKPIEPEVKQAILEAAVQAPTAGNMSLFTILDITDQAKKDAGGTMSSLPTIPQPASL